MENEKKMRGSKDKRWRRRKGGAGKGGKTWKRKGIICEKGDGATEGKGKRMAHEHRMSTRPTAAWSQCPPPPT